MADLGWRSAALHADDAVPCAGWCNASALPEEKAALGAFGAGGPASVAPHGPAHQEGRVTDGYASCP
eukprot:4042592-Lingulodinium_polyedra.AAC.1